MTEEFYQQIDELILNALEEDIGEGDHSTLACVSDKAMGSAQLIIKDEGILAGVEVAQQIIRLYDPNLKLSIFIKDGSNVKHGDLAFRIFGRLQSILTCERLILNCMQRMSGIATKTNKLVEIIQGCKTKILDTRKTTPCFRILEKWAVRIGGGQNHRYALYDMIMIKDNHIEATEGIKNAIEQTRQYLTDNNKTLKIEIEVRNLKELNEVIEVGKVDRIMLDNFSPQEITKALKLIPEIYEVEASGGINEENILEYAQTGVDFISIGAITHSFKSLDMSLKIDAVL